MKTCYKHTQVLKYISKIKVYISDHTGALLARPTQEKFEKFKVPERKKEEWQLKLLTMLKTQVSSFGFQRQRQRPREEGVTTLPINAMLKIHPSSSSSLVCSFRYSGCPFLFCIQATLSYLVN